MREDFDRLGDELREIDGFEDGWLLVDRETGRAVTFTLWDNRTALEASTEKANEMRERVASAAQYEIKAVDSYEIALRVRRFTDS
jgi:hypothetical protein